MADNTLAAILGPQLCMLAEKIRDLSLYGLSQQSTRALPQDFGELVTGMKMAVPPVPAAI